VLALVCAVLAGVATIVIGVMATPIGRALGLLDFPDDPGGRKLHARVTPLVGGLAVTTVTIAAIVATIGFGDDHGATFVRDLSGFGIAVAAMFLIGAADDRFELSVLARIAVAILVLFLVIGAVPDFAVGFVRFGHHPVLWLLGATAVPFTLLCLVGLLNAINMADGKNGIVIGMALIWSAFLLVHLPAPMVPVMAAVAASLAVLFVFNLRGRLFLGDGGSYALSAMFGLLAIDAYNHDFAAIGADDVALLFAVPVFDTLRLVASRMAAKRSPFAGGRDHLHHYLHARIGWPRGLYIYMALIALPIAAAAALPGTGTVWLAVTALAYAAVLGWARSKPG